MRSAPNGDPANYIKAGLPGWFLWMLDGWYMDGMWMVDGCYFFFLDGIWLFSFWMVYGC